MDTFFLVVAAILIIAYIVCAVLLITTCRTTAGTVCAAIVAVGVGGFVAYFLEFLVAIALCGLVLAIIKSMFL